MLKQRVTTALCIFSIFLFCLSVLPSVWFAVFIGVVLIIAAWEWANLSGFQSYPHRAIYCGIFALLLLALSVYLNLFSMSFESESTLFSILLLAGGWWTVALLWVQGYPSSSVLWGSRWVRALMGQFVLLPSALSLIYLHSLPQGAWLILFVVLIVATADTGAYFSGKAFGANKLAKDVSPGKSWEGFWGGLLCCVILALVVSIFTDSEAWPILVAIVVPTALVSVLGDLLESMVKRYRGIKDSGRILPGHGGILDRVDGLTAAAPIFALAIMISGWQLPQ